MVQLCALIDGKKVVVVEDVIRRDLRLDDADGVECLPIEEIFTELARMGYEKRRRIEAINVDEDITLVDMETQVNMDAELQRRIDQDVSAATKKAKLLDEQIAKSLHDEEVEKAAAREKKEKDDLERAKVLQKQYEDKEENIDWNTIAEKIQEK
nr:hypothetical protein [Tanacetum cinerariifolium]